MRRICTLSRVCPGSVRTRRSGSVRRVDTRRTKLFIKRVGSYMDLSQLRDVLIGAATLAFWVQRYSCLGDFARLIF